MAGNERTLRMKFDGSAKGLARAAAETKSLIKEVERAEAAAYAEQERRDAAAERRQAMLDRERAKAHDDYIRQLQAEEDALVRRGKLENDAYKEDARRAKAHEDDLLRQGRLEEAAYQEDSRRTKAAAEAIRAQGRLEEAAYQEDIRRTKTRQREYETAVKARVKAERDAQSEIVRLRRQADEAEKKRDKEEEDRSNNRSRLFKKLRDDIGSIAGTSLKTFAVWANNISTVSTLLTALVGVLHFASLASGVLGLIPGAIAAGAAAMVTLKLGAQGLTNAFKPTVDVLDKIKKSVSGTFEKELKAPVRDLNKLLPQTTGHFQGIASAVSSVIGKIVSMLKTGGNMGVVNGILDKTGSLIRKLGDFIAPVIRGFLDIADVGLGVLNDMSTGIGGVGQKFADWIRGLKNSGDLREWITKGIGAFRDFFGVIKDIGGIVVDVFSLIKEGAGTVAPVLQPAIDAVKAFLKTPEGQQAFRSLGETLAKVGDAVNRVLGPALRVIGPLIEPAGEAFANVASTLADILGPAIDELGPSLKPVVTAIGMFVDEFVKSLGPALPGIVSLFKIFGAGLVLLTPVFIGLAVATNFWVSVLIAAGQALVGNFSGAADTMKNAWETSMDSMKTVTDTDWSRMANDVLNGTTTTDNAVKNSAGQQHANWGSALGGMQSDTTTAWGAMGSTMQTQLGAMQGQSQAGGVAIRGNLSGALRGAASDAAGAGGAMAGSWGSAIGSMQNGTRAGIGDVKNQTGGLPSWINGEFSGVSLFGAGRSIMQSLGDGLRAAWGGIKSLLGGFSAQIPQQKGPPAKDRRLLRPAGRLIMAGLGKGLAEGWSGVRSDLSAMGGQLPALIPTGAGTAFTDMLNAGNTATAPTVPAAPDVYVTVMLDGKPVQALVKAEVAGNNIAVRRLAGSGSGISQ